MHGSFAMKVLILAAGLVFGASSCTTTPRQAASVLPDGMVAAAHPLAAEAGAEILGKGGNAVDAAVATAFALNVVEPHASGMGGGGFMLVYLAESQETYVLDYREVAPSGLDESVYMRDGEINGGQMRYGGKAVAVPGMARGVLRAHEKFGRLPREQLLRNAIAHASEGFPVSSDLAGHISSRTDMMLEDETAAETFLEDGLFSPEEGEALRQPKLASLLRSVAAKGDAAVYNLEAAGRIAAEVRRRGGVMTARDIVDYQPLERSPVSTEYRGYEIVTIGPPSSGGLSILQALSILNHFDLSGYEPDSPEYLAILAKALEIAQHTTDQYVADPGFVDVPIERLLDQEWAEGKARGISEGLLMEQALASAANPPQANRDPAAEGDVGNTTHFSVVDAEGNMVALTQTINYFFGSGVFIPEYGLVMNNEMYDFTYEGGNINMPAPGKRPRSSISPVLVMREGRPIAAIGSPGGRRIPSALVQILVRCIDFDEPLQQAIDAPRLYADSTRGRISYESRLGRKTIDELSRILSIEKQWEFNKREGFDNYFGGAQGIWIRETPGGVELEGGADPRRNGGVARMSDLTPSMAFE